MQYNQGEGRIQISENKLIFRHKIKLSVPVKFG